MLNSPVWRGSPSWAFGLGLVAGGVVSAFALLIVGSLLRLLAPSVVWLVVAAFWFVVLAVRETGLIWFRLPQNARLVPESVFRHGRFFGPFQFGLEMGTGVRTYVTSGLPYALIVAVALLAGPAGAVAAGIGFGLGRALMTFGNLGYDTEASWDREFDRHAGSIRTVLFLAYAASLTAVALTL
ncbi:MAG: hypothetical protein Q4G43_08930 [Mobilicoccus sp.]|nr:hypothetical protein [Mobilicoccus sp.]